MENIRFCLIGAGRAGLIHAANVAGRVKHAQLVAVCDVNAESAQHAAKELGAVRVFTDYRQALASPDIDAAIIVVPTFLHCDVAVLAAQQGKHIFLEKPMALNEAECQQIIDAADRADVRLQIGFMRRFDEGFLRAKELLASGEMGRVMIIKSTGRGPGGPGPWMWDLKKSNGIVAEVNSHDIDTLHWLTGQEVTSVFARARNFKMEEAREKFPDFYDNVVVQLDLTDGAMGVIDGTCPAGYGYDARVEVLCEKGLIMVGTYQQQGTVQVTLEGDVKGRAVKTWRTLFKEAYLAEMEEFVTSVRERRDPRVTGRDGLLAARTVTAINQSIRSGTVVAVDRSAELQPA